MTRKERFLARLAELAREYEEKLRPEQWVQSRLRWEDWATLQPEAVGFAREEIRRRKWRGHRGGVLPEGYDAESIANQAIGEMLEGKCQLAVGWTRERLMREIKRVVGRRVRVLHRLKEAAAVRSEWEGEDGAEQAGSRLKELPDGGESADAATMRREEEDRRERLIKEFDGFLAAEGEPELREIFGCLCAGVEESREIARRLGMDEKAVVRGRKKLDRRAVEFRRGLKEEG